jgi:hypothetical protein
MAGGIAKMDSYSHQVGRKPEHALPGLSHREWLAPLGESVRQALVRVRTTAAQLTRRLAGVTPDQWFLVVFIMLFLVFFVVLLGQPTVGRGGR